MSLHTLHVQCTYMCRMATKLLRLAADERREAKQEGHPPSGKMYMYNVSACACTLHTELPAPH